MGILLYPSLVAKFWYIEAPMKLFVIGKQVFVYSLYLFSLPLLIQTFFRPIKNEYHKDLILFSIIFGMVVKSFLILISLLFVIGVLILELIIFILFLAIPVFVVYIPFS